MKKKNILITIIVLVIILVIGVIIWLNYKDKKEIQAKSREILVTTIRNDIVKYCAVEEMKILGGTFEGDPICKNSDTIIDNISQITNIDPFEKILDLDFNGVVKSIELKYKDNKYVYREDNDKIIITNLDDYSYKNNDLDNDESNNTEDNNDNVTNDNNDEENDFNEDYEEVTSEVVDEIDVDNDMIKSLYKKYISYTSYETNNYKNINVNDSSSDEYLVKHSIYKILEDNKVNIKDYKYKSDDYNLGGFEYGYKVTTNQINQYIKNNFNVQRKIDFESLNLQFVINGDDADIAYYYDSTEKAYRLISDSSIPKTGAGNIIKYSKYNKHDVIGDELIIYTDFFLIGNDMGIAYINNNMDTIRAVITTLGDMEKLDVDYILNNHSNKIGKFKHVFKKTTGNYYWVSTTQIKK